MAATITGDPNAVPIEDLLAPAVVVPTPGDLAQANVVRAAIQAVLDHLASAGNEIFNIRGFGVNRIQQVASVAAIRAIAPGDRQDGQLVMLMAPGYGGGPSGLLWGVGLFVFASASVAPETDVPNVPSGYLVIAPASGSGRWINVAAGGLGFTLGDLPTFVPRPIERFRISSAQSVTVGDASTATVTGDTVAPAAPFGIELGPVTLSSDDQCSVDVSFTSSCADSASTSHTVVLEYKQGVGGTWQPVLGGVQTVSGPNNTVFPHTLSGVITAAANGNHYFRVGLQAATGKTVKTSKAWSFRGLSLSARLRRNTERQRWPSSTGSFRGSATAATSRPRPPSWTRRSASSASTRSGA